MNFRRKKGVVEFFFMPIYQIRNPWYHPGCRKDLTRKEGGQSLTAFKAFPVINLSATGANIQRLRKLSGYSVSDLQNYFGFDAPQAIYRWQRGEKVQTLDNLSILAEIFQVEVNEKIDRKVL